MKFDFEIGLQINLLTNRYSSNSLLPAVFDMKSSKIWFIVLFSIFSFYTSGGHAQGSRGNAGEYMILLLYQIYTIQITECKINVILFH